MPARKKEKITEERWRDQTDTDAASAHTMDNEVLERAATEDAGRPRMELRSASTADEPCYMQKRESS